MPERKRHVQALRARICACVCILCLSSAGCASELWLPAGLPEEIFIPAGTIIRAYPDQALQTGFLEEGEPVNFTITENVMVFRAGQVLIPRNSKITAVVCRSRQDGHFVGRASLEFCFSEILTPNWSAYPINARLSEVRGYQVNCGQIRGAVHRKKDTFFFLFLFLFLFPPTTFFQLLQIPRRGPQIRFDAEWSFAIKLMEPLVLRRDEIPSKPLASLQTVPSSAPPQAVPSTPLRPAPASFEPVATRRSPRNKIEADALWILPQDTYPVLVTRPGEIPEQYRSILEAAGWLSFVRTNVDMIRYFDQETVKLTNCTITLGVAKWIYDVGSITLPIRGKRDEEVAATIVHESAHFVQFPGQVLAPETYAQQIEQKFWADYRAVQASTAVTGAR